MRSWHSAVSCMFTPILIYITCMKTPAIEVITTRPANVLSADAIRHSRTSRMYRTHCALHERVSVIILTKREREKSVASNWRRDERMIARRQLHQAESYFVILSQAFSKLTSYFMWCGISQCFPTEILFAMMINKIVSNWPGPLFIQQRNDSQEWALIEIGTTHTQPRAPFAQYSHAMSR